MLFLALSLFSITVMVVVILKDMRASKKQWWVFLLPILLLFMTVAFRFEWTENANNDLSRYFIDFAGVKRAGANYELRHADEFSSVWRIIVNVFCQLKDYHWFPVFTVGLDFIIFFCILINVAEDKNLSTGDVLLCLLLRLSLMPLVMSVSASRNTLAYSFFSLGVYTYYKNGLKDFRTYLWMILGVLTHASVWLGVVVFVFSLLIKRYRAVIFLLPIFVALLETVIVPLMLSSSSELLQYFGEQFGYYIQGINNYDKIKRLQIFAGFLPLYICTLIWYFGKGYSPLKGRVSYMVANMTMAISFAVMNATLFLRTCYPIAILMPIVWGEFKNTQWQNDRNKRIFWLATTCSALLMFVTTFGGWLFEIYWFFKI